MLLVALVEILSAAGTLRAGLKSALTPTILSEKSTDPYTIVF